MPGVVPKGMNARVLLGIAGGSMDAFITNLELRDFRFLVATCYCGARAIEVSHTFVVQRGF